MKLETAVVPEQAPGFDRRSHVRYRRSDPVTVVAKGRHIPAITVEMSQSGLSAVLSSPLNTGEAVEIYPIAGGTVQAQVRHRVGKVFGFEFLKLTEKQSRKIAKECKHLPVYTNHGLGI
ncbi:MAG TPA: PilZ domain-containing protein [Candidatus Aquilonibacter sp.]|nr:PilZ domain-containing protein [Candidatus Aquilonibacter sp.]